MTNAYDHDNSIYFGWGEAEPVESTFTDEDWAEYDAAVEAEMRAWDEKAEAGLIDFFPGEDVEPPF